MGDLPEYISLREDELLVAIASPRARRDRSWGRRSGSYQFIKQSRRRQDEDAPERDWAAEEEDGQMSEAEVPTSLGLDFNVLLQVQRPLPEVRHPLCLQQHPGDSLPLASIILCFHDEDWAALLRTVHSILGTAPRAFLKEIILVDDLSQQALPIPGQLKSALSEHVARLEGVKLLRSNKRLGPVGARMLGAARATGDVLVFMDAHCECHPGWLEPLLSRIASDRSRVVSPVIDSVDWKTLQYQPSKELQRGVLDWKLDFHWEPLPEHEKKALQSPISPIRSPVVPREVVAVDRRYFQNTGVYETVTSPRGGENLELSFKAWLCGGSVEILPCSRVGHVYQDWEAHSLVDQEAMLRSKVCLAETWLGSFKDTFYRHSPEAFSLSQAEKPLCPEHLQLQRRLGCRTFHWFLANIYPELYPLGPRPRFSGKHWEHTGGKEIHLHSPWHLCLGVRREQVVLQNCTGEGPAVHQQHWDLQENGMIVHVLSGKCLEAVMQGDHKDLRLRLCDGKASQLWRFDQASAVDER
ncbi:polypeptide N-acetylgalactosaminyltransferase 15 isoform X3 [Ochotona princeps]|uniref:polypeptide N-acetylgalactosaminyltransferase 15 isoform X3 n=1 Tax=Ochotona princeps TaxID=9978 RepID=UPI0027153D07|nr:polypeptide N-acetylgalactosaminyltransferase 15 isoform X3 [Ochotona princeps]